MLNNSKQKYEIIGRFAISGTEYCRVKFTTSKHEQIIPTSKVATGNFVDESIVITPSKVKPIPVTIGGYKATILPQGRGTVISKVEESVDAPDKVVESTEIEPVGLGIEGSLQAESILNPKVIATNPKGKDLSVAMDELESFCEKNKLEYDAVIQVIEGHQKTHRKWRFKKA